MVTNRSGRFQELRSGAPVLFTAMLGSGVGMVGLSVFSLPFLSGPIAAEFGWERADVTVAASFFVAGLALTGPVVGLLCDRAGVRPILLVSVLLYALGLFALSRFDGSSRLFYSGYFLLALAGAGTTFASYGRIVNSWFDEHRGLALGIMMSGPGLAAAILPLMLPPIIAAHGWRGGYIALALLAISIFPLAALLMKERRGTPNAEQTMSEGMTLREAMGTRQFWAIMAGIALVSAAISGTNLNMVDLLGRQGAEEGSIRAAASIYGAFSIVGRLVVGFTLDRIHGTIVSAVMFGFTAAAALLFGIADEFVLMALAAAALGMSSGAEGDLCAYLASRYFGMKSFSEIFGWIFSALALGLAAGTAAARFLVGRTGSYEVWLQVAAACCIVAAVLYATLGRYRSSPAH